MNQSATLVQAARSIGKPTKTNIRFSVAKSRPGRPIEKASRIVVCNDSMPISYAMVLRALEQDNAKLDKRDRITIDSIRCHTKPHSPVQNVAKAT